MSIVCHSHHGHSVSSWSHGPFVCWHSQRSSVTKRTSDDLHIF